MILILILFFLYCQHINCIETRFALNIYEGKYYSVCRYFLYKEKIYNISYSIYDLKFKKIGIVKKILKWHALCKHGDVLFADLCEYVHIYALIYI